MKKPADCSIVIFGASGDLTKRKLIPALYTLFATSRLPDRFTIVGTGRSALTNAEFRRRLQAAVAEFGVPEFVENSKIEAFCRHIYYQPLDPRKPGDYQRLTERLDTLRREAERGENTLFYLSTPPSLYGTIPEALAAAGLHTEEKGWKRIVIEKPFGSDLAAARELNRQLLNRYREEQIYRIDHYLGKETVQNLLVFRFSNAIFEPLWNRSYVDFIEITSSEAIGVEKRGGYYDSSGAVADMLQNHLLQVVGLIAMEPPAAIDADSIRNESAKVLKCLRPLTPEDLSENLVLGQYGSGRAAGAPVAGYRREEGVADDSQTETFAALKLYIDNWRWNGVPFYIRTGKRLPTKVTEVTIHFQQTPHPVFGVHPPDNKLVLRIQPNEGILIKFGLKEPGGGFRARNADMEFHYADMADSYIHSAYERLLLDALTGDQTLYLRGDIVETCWAYVDPIMAYKKRGAAGDGGLVRPYPAGSWGPREAEELMGRSGRQWRDPCSRNGREGLCEL